MIAEAPNHDWNARRPRHPARPSLPPAAQRQRKNSIVQTRRELLQFYCLTLFFQGLGNSFPDWRCYRSAPEV